MKSTRGKFLTHGCCWDNGSETAWQFAPIPCDATPNPVAADQQAFSRQLAQNLTLIFLWTVAFAP
jgi:hypothetical protein